jgi:hypothetical protein
MKVTIIEEKVNSLNYLIVAYDVSKGKLNYFSKFNNSKGEVCELEDIVSNRVKHLERHFADLRTLAEENGFHGVCIACEPTGGYEKKFLKMGRRYGFFTQYVSGEATHKAKVIESNDSGKNDKKDARIIYFLASQGKTLTCDERTGSYEQLQTLNSHYEHLSLDGAKLKNRISSLQELLFPDLSLKPIQLYSKTVEAVITLYGLNPYKIATIKWNIFIRKVEKVIGHKLGDAGLSILEKIHGDAVANSFYLMAIEQSDEYERELRFYYKYYQEIAQRKEKYKEQMVDTFKETDEYERIKEIPVSLFLLSRLIAETGSLANYGGIKQLMRYGGLNLQEKQSGKFAGHLRISKKGSILMRKILGQIAFSSMIKKGALYHDLYIEKKEKKQGFYALTCVIRKTLKMIFGVYKNNCGFHEVRVFDQCFELLKAA